MVGGIDYGARMKLLGSLCCLIFGGGERVREIAERKVVVVDEKERGWSDNKRL